MDFLFCTDVTAIMGIALPKIKIMLILKYDRVLEIIIMSFYETYILQ